MQPSIPLYPIWIVDVLGSVFMVFVSLLCVFYTHRLRQPHQENVIWTYLFWFSLAMALFSVSRSVGHIAKRLLILTEHNEYWHLLQPYSGSINTLTFVIVGSITLFFQKAYRINLKILGDKEALEKGSEKLAWLNRNLEKMVEERTQELSQSEEKYRRVFEGAMDIILLLGQEGQFIDINPAGIKALGYPSKEHLMAETNFNQIFQTAADASQMLNRINRDGFCKDLECEIRRQDGTACTWLVSATATKGSDKGPTVYEIFAKDITERKKMEQQILKADRLASMGQLSAGVAHEVNNPLGLILGYTQLLLQDEPEETQRFKDLKIIEKHTKNCKKIVEDLLKFTRSSETRMQPFEVNELITEVVQVVEHQFESTHVTIGLELGDIPMCTGDEEKLKQVIMNLLMNAQQAIDGKGHILITTTHDRTKGETLITVTDTGAGMAPEILDKIFDPFFTTKPTGEGTGLGLSVSYGIVQEHGGEIRVESTPGSGTTFTVMLPARP
jgi:PAS domain S-box-containing protein